MEKILIILYGGLIGFIISSFFFMISSEIEKRREVKDYNKLVDKYREKETKCYALQKQIVKAGMTPCVNVRESEWEPIVLKKRLA